MWLENLFSKIRAKILPASERRDVNTGAYIYVEVLLAFPGYQPHPLGGSNSSFSSVKMYPDRCRPLVPEVVGQVMLGVPFIKRPLYYKFT